jgi:hypothetical protein
MSNRYDEEVRAERARNLGTLNGMKLVFVELHPLAMPTHALLDVEFYNDNVLGDIDTAVNTNGVPVGDIFRIRGGTKMVGGENPGEVQVTALSHSSSGYLQLRVEPIGDYSTYTLSVTYLDGAGKSRFDLLFDNLPFKFRPGCFNINCAPDFEEGQASDIPGIDYLAKDFESFKHVLINAMRDRVPDWEPTSEADLDQVILDLLAADGDLLSDFQDRVMAEAYLGRARRRVSLARHARLMDYHIHQGNQASTMLAFEVNAAASTSPVPIGAEFGVWTGENWNDSGSVIFITSEAHNCYPALNRLEPYTWDGALMALDAGATSADLALPVPLDPTVEADANALRDLFRSAEVRYIAIYEDLNPSTGTANGRDIRKRQLLTLVEGDGAAESVFDPMGGGTGRWFVRVHWLQSDGLEQRYCFITRCTGKPPIENVSVFTGNLVDATQGRPHRTTFRPASEMLASDDNRLFVRLDERHFEETPWGIFCTMPRGPLAYRETPPGGELRTKTTLRVMVDGFASPWEEQIDLIESQGASRHFIVETDEQAFSHLRFGTGVNGMSIPAGAKFIICEYQVGRGSEGNVGADTLTGFDAAAAASVQAVWNPFDVVNGRDPETRDEIVRRVPEAYRSRQLRAVTLADYVARASELDEVSHAHAQYRWTGSWRTVRMAIDPVGTTVLDRPSLQRIERHLDAVRLIGEDLEVRVARYVSLDINLQLCVHPDYWAEDLSAELEMEFSDSYTAEGRPGFFHPDEWTFGQALHASQLIGRAMCVKGVERVLLVSMRRWNAGAGSPVVVVVTPEELGMNIIDSIEVDDDEIIRVSNDPNHLELGRILFDIRGGRQ